MTSDLSEVSRLFGDKLGNSLKQVIFPPHVPGALSIHYIYSVMKAFLFARTLQRINCTHRISLHCRAQLYNYQREESAALCTLCGGVQCSIMDTAGQIDVDVASCGQVIRFTLLTNKASAITTKLKSWGD